ncbi:hypothetical protein GCM10027414_13230 [Humibacter ginsengiterrae]
MTMSASTWTSATLVHMATTRNITLALPADLIRRAKIYAAAHDTSISALVADVLANRVELEDDYDEAWAREFELMRSGMYRIGDVTWTRDELHERV